MFRMISEQTGKILIRIICCVELPCHHNNGGCEHICTNTPTVARCSCRNGYQLVNGKSCKGTLLTLIDVIQTY